MLSGMEGEGKGAQGEGGKGMMREVHGGDGGGGSRRSNIQRIVPGG